jgi:hypothetical protein
MQANFRRSLRLISGFLLTAVTLNANAIIVRYDLQGVEFNDGGSASGSFVYNFDTKVHSNIAITTTPGGNYSGQTYSFWPVNANSPFPDTFKVFAASSFVQPGSTALVMISSIDGSLDLRPFAGGESLCLTSPCSGAGQSVARRNLAGGTLRATVIGGAGGSQTAPVLPDSSNDGTWLFDDVVSGSWIDPPNAYGYTYTMTSDALFTRILGFPTGFSSPFEVLLGETSLGFFEPGDQLSFGAGVASFSLRGINPLVDPEDPNAFPLQLEFNTGFADLTMTPMVVPAPAAFWLLGTGIGFVAWRGRRRALATAGSGSA